MKKNLSYGFIGRFFLFLAISLVTVYMTAGDAQAALDCNGCHGSAGPDYRPVDASYRNITSGGMVGNHRTHMPAVTATQASCNPCHGNTGYTSSHRNGFIKFTPSIRGGQYLKGGFAVLSTAQSATPAAATCSTVDCHFRAATAVWGSAVVNCASCHVAVVSSLSHPKHTAYASYGGGGAGSCVSCHPARPTFGHASTAGIRNIAMLPTMNYVGGNTKYLPGDSGRTLGNCSTTYCHSDGTKTSGFTSNSANPTWGGTTTCASCHADTTTLNTYAHAAHIRNAGVIGVNITCDKCHSATTTNGTTVVIGGGTHADNAINVNMATGTYSLSPHAPGVAPGTCATTYCHSTGKTATGIAQPAAVAWNAAAWANKCNGCHGTGNAVGSPDYASNGQAGTNANSHNTHAITKAINCAICHQATTLTGNTIIGTKHIDGGIQDVSFGTFNGQAQGSATYNAGAKSCSATYCHSTGSAIWGGAVLTCAGCHGDSTTIVTGKHAAHTNPTFNAWLGAGSSIGCVECHASVVTNNTTISASGAPLHANGMKDYSGAKAPRTTFNSGTGTCTTYCHSNGKGISKDPGTWAAGPAINNCKGCHGTGASLFGEPDYASVGVGLSTSNSHAKHVTLATDCVRCHVKTAGAVAGTIVTGSVDHIDRNVDARFSKLNFTTYSGAYNLGARTCSATYCHGGSVTAPAWGTVGPLVCDNCHKSSNALPTGHTVHYATATVAATGSYTNAAANLSAGTVAQFSCASCHGNTAANHANGPVVAGSDANIFFGFSSAGRGVAANTAYVRNLAGTLTDPQGFKYTPGGAGNCNATYCHSNGQGGSGFNTTYTWNSPGGGATLGCNGCHGDAASAATLSGKHAQHIGTVGTGGNFLCVDCHSKTVSNNTTISNKALHVNKFREYSGAKAGRNMATCNTSYCHSNGKGGNGAAVTWTGTAIGCDGCHGLLTGTGMPNYANTGANQLGSNSHAKHVASSVDCYSCHANSVTPAGTALVGATHLDKIINVSFNTAAVGNGIYPGAGKTCSTTWCHFSGAAGSVIWGGDTVTTSCEKCHGSSNTSLPGNGGLFKSTAGVTTFTDALAGAHVAHLAANTTAGHNIAANVACAACHKTFASFSDAGHINGGVTVGAKAVSSGYTDGIVWSSLATKSGALTPSYDPATGNCSNVYCHGASLTGGTNKTPSWKTPYLTSTIADCNTCHGNPPLTPGHLLNGTGPGYVTATSCSSCHSAVNADGFTFNSPTTHINGVRDGGSCDSCHGYPPVKSLVGIGIHNNYTSAKLQNYSGGGGAHNIPGHLALIANATNSFSPCNICHLNAIHGQGGTNVIPGNVQVAVDPKYKFDSKLPITYTGKQTGSPLSTGTCFNVSCHFKASPKWSTER